MQIYIIHQTSLSASDIVLLKPYFDKLYPYSGHWRGEVAEPINSQDLAHLRAHLDINPLPADFNPHEVCLLITDMDSTLIAIECVDEIADFAQLKPQVAAITEAAMRGELDFKESLSQRVALLKNLPEDTLKKVYDERLKLNPGAEKLIEHLKEKGIETALVSGGFTYFTDRLQAALGITYSKSNELGFVGDKLTGTIKGEIVDGQAKADFLKKLCKTGGFDCKHTIAVGDGANDLPMMRLAGLSVAYHAKEAVRSEAKAQINFGGLDRILDFLAD